MNVLVDFNLVVIGSGISISKYIIECEKILKKYNLKTNIHAFGTNIEGDWEIISSAIGECHSFLHASGVNRILSSLKISSRNDREQNIQEKINSVKEYV